MTNDNTFVYDLQHHILTNDRARRTISSCVSKLEHANKVRQDGGNFSEILRNSYPELIKACGMNLGMVIPHFFPRFKMSEDGSQMLPLSFGDRPYMYAMTSLVPDSILTLKSGRQVGKCVDGNTVVSTNKGDMTMAELYELGTPVLT